MKANRQRNNWWVDAVLFVAFIVAFFLNLTGVILHQFLGVAAALMAAYHLLTHWDWVKAVTRRLLGQTSGRSRFYYAVDAALMLGFALMSGSGLVISSWLDLPLDNYTFWKNTHVATSLFTLVFAVVKVLAHWRWIVDTANKHILKPAVAIKVAPIRQTARATGRRDFLKLAGFTGVTAVVAMSKALGALDVQPEVAIASSSQAVTAAEPDTSLPSALPQTTATTEPTASVAATSETVIESTATAAATTQPTSAPAATAAVSVASACTVLCNKGCSFPGRCRKYIDQNGNNKCDCGECL